MGLFREFSSTRLLYIFALEYAIKYIDSFIDAHASTDCGNNIWRKRTKEEIILSMGGKEIYDEWMNERKDLLKQLRILEKREGR